jgi:hypothetical protein
MEMGFFFLFSYHIRWGFAFLTITSFFLCVFFALFFPFLGDWTDE